MPWPAAPLVPFCPGAGRYHSAPVPFAHQYIDDWGYPTDGSRAVGKKQREIKSKIHELKNLNKYKRER